MLKRGGDANPGFWIYYKTAPDITDNRQAARVLRRNVLVPISADHNIVEQFRIFTLFDSGF